MERILISDEKNNFLAFDLIDILKVIDEKALLSIWKISDVECIGEDAEKLHNISDMGIQITGKELFSISSNLLQIIDGDFEAYLGPQKLPWLIIKAVDSSEYEVESDDENVINKLKISFSNVVDLLKH